MVYSQPGGFINAIHMFDPYEGVALGDPVGGTWTIAKTTDGGASWSRAANEPVQVGSEVGIERLVGFAGNSHLWFSSNQGGRIYRTSDRGESWSVVNSPWSGSSLMSMSDSAHAFIANLGYPPSRQGALTDDGGATWTTIGLPVETYANTALHDSDLWVGGERSIRHSTDLGRTWISELNGLPFSITDLSFVSEGTSLSGWAVGWVSGRDTGGIASYHGAITSAVAPVLPDYGRGFSLGQSFPNPFNPATVIGFGLPSRCQVTLVIYNAAGQRIASLLNQQLDAGRHESRWTTHDDATGFYFYRLEAVDADDPLKRFDQVGKMLLIR
jgi:hypothetical protein